MAPKENFPKIEEIKEIKSEVPSYVEFLKNYKSDKLVESSYQSEYEAQLVQDPQYGPGKRNFRGLYRRIKRKLGEPVTCKISAFSDDFDRRKNYSCAIIYAKDGEFK